MNERARLQHTASMPNGGLPDASNSRTNLTSWPQHGNPDLRKVSPPTPEEKRKKKKGLAKIWSIVTGSTTKPKSEHSHTKSADFKANGGNKVYAIPDDDYPLAPPPPLSYLVDRDGGGTRSRRHSSTPCLPGTVAQPPNQQGHNGVPASPPTAPSSTLPSPASPRMPPAVNDIAVMGMTGPFEQENDPQRQQLVGGRSLISPSNSGLPSPRPISPLPQRPHTMVLGRDKNLPPLPLNESPSVGFPSTPDMTSSSRPQTMYAAMENPRHIAPAMETVSENFGGGPNLFSPPQIAFRSDGRRLSFGGMERPRVLGPNPYDTPRGTRQNVPSSYTPPNGNFNAYNTYHGNGVAGDTYGEFGSSRVSLGWMDDVQKSQPPHSQAQSYKGRMSSIETNGTGTRSKTPSKRKSRFGLTSVFGKKKDETSGEDGDSVRYSIPSSEVHQLQYSDGRTPGVGPRTPITPRKEVQQLVEQDPEFLAYRYPSNDILQQR